MKTTRINHDMRNPVSNEWPSYAPQLRVIWMVHVTHTSTSSQGSSVSIVLDAIYVEWWNSLLVMAPHGYPYGTHSASLDRVVKRYSIEFVPPFSAVLQGDPFICFIVAQKSLTQDDDDAAQSWWYKPGFDPGQTMPRAMARCRLCASCCS